MTLEDWGELLKIDGEDDVPVQHADEEQQKEKRYLMVDVKVSDLDSYIKEDLIIMINALRVQV